jgi:cytochrome c
MTLTVPAVSRRCRAAVVALCTLWAPLTAQATAGDAKRGEPIYARCAACHALEYDRTGPRHCGLLGRTAGTVQGFAYSSALKRSGIVWSAATLDRFLADPMRAVPGTSMGYDGVKDARERSDLIAYLAAVQRSAACAVPR